MQQGQGESSFVRLGNDPVHILALPLHRQDELVGGLAIVHDVSYIREQSSASWREAFLRVLVQVFLIVLITLADRALEHRRPDRAGRAVDARPSHGQNFFIASKCPTSMYSGRWRREVATLAESLSQARNAAENEARLREAGESMWTADRLAVQVQTRLDGGRLFVVSNREPYMHQRNGKSIEVVVPPSGLVTALEPVLNACDGTWIAHGSGDADAEVVDAHDRLRVPPDEPSLHAAPRVANQRGRGRLLLRICQ